MSFVIGVGELWLLGCGISGPTLPAPDSAHFIASVARRTDGTFVLNVVNETQSIQRILSPQVSVADSVSLMPDRDWIVFAGREAGDPGTDLYIIEADPRAVEAPLTRTPEASELQPDCSSDGREVVYELDGDIWLLELDADHAVVGEPSNLTQTPDVSEGQPTLSPDGSHIAYTREPAANDSGIEVMRSDGTGRRNLINDPGYDEYLPAWSPDGSRVAYTARKLEGDGAGHIDVWTSAVDGSDPRNVTGTDGRYAFYNPRWSPDGSQLAFLSLRLGEAAADIFISGAGGEGRHRFRNTSESETDLDWR